MKFIFNFKPVSKERPRFTRSGHPYTPKKTKEYEAKIHSFAWREMRANKLNTLIEPVMASIVFKFKKPKTSKLLFPGPDIDNLCKALLDGLNGVAFIDDKQVVQITALKVWADQDEVNIVIEPV